MFDTVELDDYRPHIALQTLDGNAHVIPVMMVDGIIEGRIPISDNDLVIRSILSEWLRMVHATD